jgi:hypothetical protein
LLEPLTSNVTAAPSPGTTPLTQFAVVLHRYSPLVGVFCWKLSVWSPVKVILSNPDTGSVAAVNPVKSSLAK